MTVLSFFSFLPKQGSFAGAAIGDAPLSGDKSSFLTCEETNLEHLCSDSNEPILDYQFDLIKFFPAQRL